MFVNLLGIAVVCLTTLLYLRWTRVKRYWADRGVPHLPPHPVMGSLTFLQRMNPDKLYEEVLEVKAQSENGNLEIAKLADAPYLNSVIKETLRKYPSMGWLDRVALRDYKINEQFTVTAGTPVYVNAVGMHYDEDYFPDPLNFDAERFLPENKKEVKPFTYMPFGEGPRSCVGKRFGQISVRHAISHIMLHYNVSPLPDAPKPHEVEFEKHGLFLVPGQNLYVNFIPRN